MKRYGSIESIKNNEAKIIMDTGEVLYRDVESINPPLKVNVGRVVCIQGYELSIDLKEEKKRRKEIIKLQNSIFNRGGK